MILLLDTTKKESTSIYLLNNEVIRMHTWKSQHSQQESLHEQIEKFLRRCKIDLRSLKKIGAVTGPGPFSRVRTGVVTANTLGYVLGVPVVGIKKVGEELDLSGAMKQRGQKTISVYYDREPNITKPAKK